MHITFSYLKGIFLYTFFNYSADENDNYDCVYIFNNGDGCGYGDNDCYGDSYCYFFGAGECCEYGDLDGNGEVDKIHLIFEEK